MYKGKKEKKKKVIKHVDRDAVGELTINVKLNVGNVMLKKYERK